MVGIVQEEEVEEEEKHLAQRINQMCGMVVLEVMQRQKYALSLVGVGWFGLLRQEARQSLELPQQRVGLPRQGFASVRLTRHVVRQRKDNKRENESDGNLLWLRKWGCWRLVRFVW
jgi:hypothetical protein